MNRKGWDWRQMKPHKGPESGNSDVTMSNYLGSHHMQSFVDRPGVGGGREAYMVIGRAVKH